MSMNDFENLTPETEVYQPPMPFANVFGENVVEDGYTAPRDQAGPPGPRSSAMRIQQDADRRRQASESARVREELDRAAALEGDAEAYRRVMDDRLAGRGSDPRDEAAALRHAKAAGILQPRSPAQIIADRAQGITPAPATRPVTTAPARGRMNPDKRRALLQGRGSTGR